MRWKLLLLSLFWMFTGVKADAAKHCYALEDVSVLNRKGKETAVIKAGTTFNYQKKKAGFVRLNYYGKIRYVRTKNLVTDKFLNGYVKANPSKFGLRIKVKEKGCVYKSVSVDSKRIQKFSKNEQFNVEAEYSNWYQVRVDGERGFIPKMKATQFHYVNVSSFYRPIGNTKRERITDYAKKFIGNPYVWGGTSLTSGADCSGFVQAVFKHFGISISRCSYQQAENGRPVSKKNARPGDLLFFIRGSRVGHVGMYLGNGKMVEAKGARWGIVISDVDLNSVHCIRNVID